MVGAVLAVGFDELGEPFDVAERGVRAAPNSAGSPSGFKVFDCVWCERQDTVLVSDIGDVDVESVAELGDRALAEAARL